MNNVRRRALAEDRDGFRFRGGNPAIDLTATLQGRLKPVQRELLATPQDLDRWLVSSGLAEGPPEASEQDLQQARALRESIFALAEQLDRRPLDGHAIETLNQVAAGHAAAPQLRPDGSMVTERSASGLLTLLAREAIQLLSGANSCHIRQCEAPQCTIFFVDNSRSGDRRWCSMAGCGNKAKVAEHRKRRRAAADLRSVR